MKYCERCKTEVDDVNLFCPKCGFAVKGTVDTPNTQNSESSKNSSNGENRSKSIYGYRYGFNADSYVFQFDFVISGNENVTLEFNFRLITVGMVYSYDRTLFSPRRLRRG